jgi:glycosyltransferase involved in cell wall biosynthesis
LQGKKVFLFCGQLRPRKQIELLFEALRKLRVNDPEYHLVVAGGSPAQSGLQELAGRSGIGDAITWLGPLYNPDELAPWFLMSRALVVPRAIGLAVLHACAYGLPCITTADRRYQTPEVAALRQGYNCCLFRDGDAQDLAEKLRLLAEDDRLQEELGRNARTTIEQEYTMEKMVEGFVQAVSYAAARMKDRNRS